MNGILLLDKPEGLSSNAALQRVKRLLCAQKAGHVGSLDPLATGMLPICLGEATKIAGEIVGGRKRYAFEVVLGSRTDTGDRAGAVIETAPVPALDAEAVEGALSRFRGRLAQVPPMYSALKLGGRPLYRLARAGIEVERAPREIEIDELTPTAIRGGVLGLEALCSKGTYIRVLGEDIARALGTCGHVVRLRRLFVAPFEREQMLTLEKLEAMCRAGDRPELIDAGDALKHMPALVVSADAARRLAHGQTIAASAASVGVWMGVSAGAAPVHPERIAAPPEGASATSAPVAPGRVRLYDRRGRFLGLGETDDRETVRPKRMFLVGEGGSE